MRNVSDKNCIENQNTSFIFDNFYTKNRAVYEILWKNMVRPREATEDNMADCLLDS